MLGLRRLDRWQRRARSLGHFWAFGRVAILSERMSQCHVDDAGRLHREDGPAMAYRDGTKVYAVNGVRVPADVVEDPGSLGAERISAEDNTEVRRVMMERYGLDRYLREAGAELVDQVHEPPFPGLIDAKLWRLDQPDDEPLVMVECRNSTREPDGEFKTYWLRVDPACETAQAAVAWTWELAPDEYVPTVET